MKRFLFTLLLLLKTKSFVSYSQEWIDDSNFDEKSY